MNTLAEKISNPILLKVKLIAGAVLMAVAMLALPIGIFIGAPALVSDPSVWCVILAGMLFFGLVGIFGFIRPYILYGKLPAVQVEADDEFLYIHTTKEAKIPLAELTEVSAHVDLPYLFQKELLRELIIHFFSEEYADITLEISGYGTYKVRFVAYAQRTADEIISFLNDAMDRS